MKFGWVGSDLRGASSPSSSVFASSPVANMAVALLLAAEMAGADAPLSLDVCHGGNCRERVTLTLNDADVALITRVFTPPPADAASERTAIARAIGEFERIAVERAGLPPDQRENFAWGEPGQQDCVDESRNTETYLGWMNAEGLLHHHAIAERAVRAWFILDQHWTATVTERASGERYAVDSWFGANGDAPEIQTLARWYFKRRP